MNEFSLMLLKIIAFSIFNVIFSLSFKYFVIAFVILFSASNFLSHRNLRRMFFSSEDFFIISSNFKFFSIEFSTNFVSMKLSVERLFS